MNGYVALVLHTHLPHVRHPEHESFLEEDWLFEAITETYLPLLSTFETLREEEVPFRLSISLSPPLVQMLDDPLLRRRYQRYLDRRQELLTQELERTASHGHLNYLAEHYRRQTERVRELWERHGGDLCGAFALLQEQGYLEILTCAATHGFLPLLRENPEAVWAQIKVATDHHRARFGRAATGIWLPECGIYPGLDEMLARAGLRYTICDSHALLLARPRPRFGTHAPVYSARSGVATFARDVESSQQVWSRQHGYPGAPVYREFYRDIGFDLEQDYIGPFVQPDGARKNTGIKYYRITGNTEHKELYDPYWAQQQAEHHAEAFVLSRQRQLQQLARQQNPAPIVVSPYDAELFGHWWYEGPWWLESVLRRASASFSKVRLTTLEGYLREHPTHQVCNIAPSSWGERGFNEYWLNDSNAWVYPHLHRAAREMTALCAAHPRARGVTRRALNQAARELLLAQASDWAFIMRTGTVVDYAVGRTRSHLQRFFHLARQIQEGTIDEPWLQRLEYLDNIFPALDHRVFAPLPAEEESDV